MTRLPPDSLPADRLSDALALARFLHRHPMEFFVEGSPSGSVARDLERLGLIQLEPEPEGEVVYLRVVSLAGEVSQ